MVVAYTVALVTPGAVLAGLGHTADPAGPVAGGTARATGPVVPTAHGDRAGDDTAPAGSIAVAGDGSEVADAPSTQPSLGEPHAPPAVGDAPGVRDACPGSGDGDGDRLVDVDGDGCAERVMVEGGTISVELSGDPVTFAVGREDDLVFVGDWDCDGIATPAVHRPDSGELFTYAAWPETGAVVEPTLRAVPPGQPLDAADTGGCAEDAVGG